MAPRKLLLIIPVLTQLLAADAQPGNCPLTVSSRGAEDPGAVVVTNSGGAEIRAVAIAVGGTDGHTTRLSYRFVDADLLDPGEVPLVPNSSASLHLGGASPVSAAELRVAAIDASGRTCGDPQLAEILVSRRNQTRRDIRAAGEMLDRLEREGADTSRLQTTFQKWRDQRWVENAAMPAQPTPMPRLASIIHGKRDDAFARMAIPFRLNAVLADQLRSGGSDPASIAGAMRADLVRIAERLSSVAAGGVQGKE